ncbi:putative hybrid sensor histidine kinase [Cupriavidus taiwanensis]|uniref:ATP-binding response regulator n=1 Tax=Cupriavidus taiwanensis TaxID=164546 RepID=UPI000E128310|nr:hybrid sensor histidine kinase/response regulator [Cupriavidus taiwanensis]SOZ20539.1 putative hybrid sensor histidine kinase [Cupriavidus taiwanensis]SOZ33555.1 putative hybrid sensor histidine kinase [Cupriavidus taiwanensis]SOZ48829.1 putative hybrid sensor histidine kinase [Cupriavidus taiwanensis]
MTAETTAPAAPARGPLRWLPRYDAPRILAAQMTLIDHSFGCAMAGSSLAAVFLAAGLVLNWDRPGALPWAGAMVLACAVAYFGRLWLPGRLTEAGAARYARGMTAMLMLIGALWGLVAWLYLDVRMPAVVICILSLIAGMSAAALAVFSACLPVAIGFFVPAIVPVWIAFLATGDIEYLPMFLATPLYLCVLLVFARNYARVARQSIALRFENVELISQLREQTARAEAAQHAAEEASRAKSVFLASASHDLRQPLHAMGLFLVSLGRTHLDERQRQLLAHIEASSGAAREMLNSLLDFSKLEAGVITPRARAFRLQPLLHKLENEFAPQAEARGLVYRTRDTTVTLHGDPTLVELVLRNLIANAIRYTQRGGVLVACRKRGARATIEVWDTGIGIPAAQHRDIFREFHQLGNPERDQRKGLGLGLAIVEGLARTMQTRVTLASSPGRGSVFRFGMPQAWESPEESPRPPAARALDGLRVLVIDDDEAIRSAMSELLSAWRCECRTVESEEQALAALAQFTPKLVLADYRLRGHRTGQQALDAIRQRLGRHVPAIIITGDTAADRLRTAHASGTALLHKPVVPQELQAAIDTLLREFPAQVSSAADRQAAVTK